MLTPAQYTTLNNELKIDPRVYGYAPFLPPNIADYNGAASLLNLVRNGSNGGPVIIVKRADVSPLEILNCIDIRDFIANPSGLNSIPMAQSWLESITQFPRIRLFNDDGTQTLIKNNLDRLLNNTNGSQTLLNAVGKRNGSRAEELFGRDVIILDSDVESAVRLG